MHVAGISAATIDRALKLLPEQSKRDLASAPPKPARIRAFGDIDVAEDAVQDAFAVALRKWSATACRPPAGWITTPAHSPSTGCGVSRVHENWSTTWRSRPVQFK